MLIYVGSIFVCVSVYVREQTVSILTSALRVAPIWYNPMSFYSNCDFTLLKAITW